MTTRISILVSSESTRRYFNELVTSGIGKIQRTRSTSGIHTSTLLFPLPPLFRGCDASCGPGTYNNMRAYHGPWSLFKKSDTFQNVVIYSSLAHSLRLKLHLTSSKKKRKGGKDVLASKNSA